MSVATTVDKSGERVREMFGEISGRYDFLNHLLSGGTDIYWRSRTVKMVPPVGTTPILDVCTGTGDLALAYWRKGRGAIEVVGTDFTPQMLRIAETKRNRKPLGPHSAPLTFLEADTQQLPFKSDRFQIVSVAFGLRNVSNTEQGVREMVRVCQPGGRVCILEFSMPSGVFGRFYRWYFKNVLPRIGQFFARNRQAAYNYLPDSVSEFPYGKDLADRLTNWGLTEVTYHPLTFGIATLYLGKKSGVTPAG